LRLLPSTPSSPERTNARPAPRRALLWLIAIAVVVLVTVVTVAIASSGGDSAAPGPPGCRVQVAAPASPRVAPGFRAPGLRGGCVDLAAYAGRPIVVNFWASYCHPCRQEFPLFRRALRRYRSAELQVIGVSHDDIDRDAIAFADEFGATWPLSRDPDGAIADAYVLQPPGIPQSFFVRRDGTISAHLFGDPTSAELNHEIERITRA
jgi:cytochrome c biogenesis protein CcmG, thiol:disulfide interchange protein DsbE